MLFKLNRGIPRIPYSFRRSFEKRAQFASVSALQNDLHIERNRLRVASIEVFGFSETNKKAQWAFSPAILTHPTPQV